MGTANAGVITSVSVSEYFQGSITKALRRQHLQAREHTAYYLVQLLTRFVHSEALFEQTDDGTRIRPLALRYQEAVDGATPRLRNRALQKLGDIALFVAGVFSDSLNRKIVDVDYYIAMGGTAYGHLAEIMRGTQEGQTLTPVFDELAEKFTDFVDVLASVNEQAEVVDHFDVMRTYEVWLRTGSKRAARRLRQIGIEPQRSLHPLRHH